ncbi:MAG: peptidase M23 [Desulfobacteraceae bacterium 4572_130]|nr:MAG: peptidase M23 [Desulfobacteraceae bacterium 4572_130]
MKNFIRFMVLLAGVLSAWFFINQFEGKKPEISFDFPLYLNKSWEIILDVSDKGTGLKDIKVSIMQNNKENLLFEKKYPSTLYKGISMGSGIFQDSFKILLELSKYDIIDGQAFLKIYISDYSWAGWKKGNISSLEKKIIIDTKPPKIEILSGTHNITKGGTGLVIYRVFENDIKTGVQVGENFFPGYSGMFKDKNFFAAFFALNYKQGPGTNIFVKAEDMAGNSIKRGFHYYIRDKKFKTDTLNITNSFLARKMPEFNFDSKKEEEFSLAKNPFLQKFIYINSEVRKQNINELIGNISNLENKIMWHGPMLRLPSSANKAGFADYRTYKYKGKTIDSQTHLGIDLASFSRSPVLAANKGKVIKTKNIGIFGNSIILDHGFGLCSIYSHLSEISVEKGRIVEKGEIIGKTGSTGLAGGDHLHFGVSINNVFVNPVEWWDKKWIQDNILLKIENVKMLEND